MIKSAQISPCEQYRWSLSRVWGDDGGRMVCWLMLNPSTADAEIDDPTVKRCIHFSKSWGYDGLVIVNIFPFRSSRPDECKRWIARENQGARDVIHHKNRPLVVETAKASSMVVAAYGAGDWYQNEAANLLEDITCNRESWPDIYCLGTNKRGRPLHPMARGKLRVPNDQKPILFTF